MAACIVGEGKGECSDPFVDVCSAFPNGTRVRLAGKLLRIGVVESHTHQGSSEEPLYRVREVGRETVTECRAADVSRWITGEELDAQEDAAAEPETPTLAEVNAEIAADEAAPMLRVESYEERRARLAVGCAGLLYSLCVRGVIPTLVFPSNGRIEYTAREDAFFLQDFARLTMEVKTLPEIEDSPAEGENWTRRATWRVLGDLVVILTQYRPNA